MASPNDREPLIALPRALLALTGRPVGYNVVWRNVVSGTIPAERIGAKWFFDPADVPRIAQALGLEPVESTPAAA